MNHDAQLDACLSMPAPVPATSSRWKKAAVMVALALIWLALGTVAATFVGMATGLIQTGSE